MATNAQIRIDEGSGIYLAAYSISESVTKNLQRIVLNDSSGAEITTFPVTGTFWQATQPVSLASVPSHAVTNAGTFATQATLAAETTKVIGTINVAASQTIAVTNVGTFAVQATLQANSGVDIGKLTANQSVNVSQINGVTTLMGNGVTGTGSIRVTIASDNTAFSVNATLAAETTKVIGTVNIAAAQTLATVTTVSTVTAITGGGVAHDGVDSGNPIKTGGRARSSEISPVASDDRVDFISDLAGKQIVLPYANPENFVSASTAAITDTTSTSVIASAGGSLRNYITSVIVTNSHATVGTFVKITDGSGGTVLWQGYAAAAGGGFTMSFPTPLRGSAATAIHAVCVTTGANVIVAAAGYKGV